ncbi:unnamed protein product [Hydatigera taeniaeformis]|uniref:LisH domain-containing protein n=1 Tax=Hydatigena taeniaeformis TaxID=6205 RepID=A0A0R3XDH4_HYDTA|nr:unnamed protein product [Hydatigera taeniaeformis]
MASSNLVGDGVGDSDISAVQTRLSIRLHFALYEYGVRRKRSQPHVGSAVQTLTKSTMLRYLDMRIFNSGGSAVTVGEGKIT